MKEFKKIIQVIFFLIVFSVSIKSQNEMQVCTENDRNDIRIEMEELHKKELELWYPLCLDTVYGGYYSDINYKWELQGMQNKMIVSQARHVWSASNAGLLYKNKEKFWKIAKHGFKFLRDVMWDNEDGGFYDLVDREGNVIKENGKIIKRAYGNSFAIYGLAAYFMLSKDSSALQLAQDAFYWLDKNSYDQQFGGYFQFMERNGKPFEDGYMGTMPKDHNSTIHLLECFTELYKVWKNDLLRERLLSLLRIIRDRITTEKGYMNLFFTKEWKAVSFRDSTDEERTRNYFFDHVSFGHDIETAYLLLEASEVLGLVDDTTTLKIAKKMVDHTILYGWDSENDGIFDGGYYFNLTEKPVIVKNTKEWWAQAEAMNTMLIFSKLFPSDEMNYYQKFCEQWNYIKSYLIDYEYGGWYWGGIDIVPNNKFLPKGSIWKVNYHTSRSLSNSILNLSK